MGKRSISHEWKVAAVSRFFFCELVKKKKKVKHPDYVFMGLINGHQQRCAPILLKNQQESIARNAIPFCVKLIKSNQFLQAHRPELWHLIPFDLLPAKFRFTLCYNTVYF